MIYHRTCQIKKEVVKMKERSFEDLFFGWILYPVAIVKWVLKPMRLMLISAIVGGIIVYLVYR
jgi:hypothetical protein